MLPSVCAIECTIPKDTFVNAKPATIDACSISSLASLSPPFLYALGKNLNISPIAAFAKISLR